MTCDEAAWALVKTLQRHQEYLLAALGALAFVSGLSLLVTIEGMGRKP